MYFNSFEYLILFLPIVFVLYWAVLKKQRLGQNILLLTASYVFYGFWNWKFLGLIILSSSIDYFLSLQIEKTRNKRIKKWLLRTSIIANLGILGFFKYYNFFIYNLIAFLHALGIDVSFQALSIILPVGISFYTFQSISYTVDVYKGRTLAEKSALSFYTYIAFFPQLVAGPIERAAHMLPQFNSTRSFNYEQGRDGARMVLWGLFLKTFVSGNIESNIYLLFNRPANFGSLNLFIGQISFYIQLYCDFAGYSYIAIGTAKLFGFQLSRNFNYPFLASTWSDFWARWHITLTKWFRDYLLIPMLRISRANRWRFIAVFLNLLLIGLWHGAQWTYVFAFSTSAIYYIPSIFFNKKVRLAQFRFLQSVGLQLIISLHLLFFRTSSMIAGAQYLKAELNPFRDTHDTFLWLPALMILLVVVIGYLSRNKEHPLENINPIYSWPIYIILSFCILNSLEKSTPFIYFQF